ncbi:MAG: hypothetical protein PHS53_03560 [Candidatus Pacebacteria bacterium]|nr:hypothetical protein [Candidatus Paceibacterota bacterium]
MGGWSEHEINTLVERRFIVYTNGFMKDPGRLKIVIEATCNAREIADVLDIDTGIEVRLLTRDKLPFEPDKAEILPP